MWISPRAFLDFGWTLLSRILVNLGNAFGTSLLLYFLMYGLEVPDAEAALILAFIPTIEAGALAVGKVRGVR